MKVVVALEHRFDRTPDGAVWTQTMFAHRFWTRYLDVFDHVHVVARLRPVAKVSTDWERADGPGVSFADVPHYIGPWQYLRAARGVKRAVRDAVGPDDAVILRVPSMLGTALEATLRRTGQPYAVEVVADPYDVFAPRVIRHPLRPLFRWWFSRNLRRQCAAAVANAYVTERALQRRYPSAAGNPMIALSDVELPEEAFAVVARRVNEGWPISLIMVGALAQTYKGADILIEAVADCVRGGLDLNLIIVGDGKHRPDLEAEATRLGLADRVTFRGQLSAGTAVRSELDHADLFVMPSRLEGLPRAMIEAMARALPCIGSAVGGIPELLAAEELVPTEDVAALASRIRDVVADRERMSSMSARNLERARDFSDDALRERRRVFYQLVLKKTGERTNRDLKPVLAHVSTVAQMFRFLSGQISYVTERGFDVHCVASGGPYLQQTAEREPVTAHTVEIRRQITPVPDLVALVRLWQLWRRIRPEIVHAHSPKGGLLGMTSAWAARVPVRIYHNHGLPHLALPGHKRILVRLSERVSCRMAQEVFCVSHSVRSVLIEERLCPAAKIRVFLAGSINGVDATGRFDPKTYGPDIRQRVRADCGIPADAPVVGFVGRITRDKGLTELVEAWQVLREERPGLHLLVVGPYESLDPVPTEVYERLQQDRRICLTGSVDDPIPLYTAMDVFVLPSYPGEGFPVVLLEAPAMGLPVVASRIPGNVDAVIDGVTGLLVPPYDALALTNALRSYLDDQEMRQEHGKAGRARVIEEFRPEALWEATYQEYARLLRERGRPVPAPAAKPEITIPEGVST